MKTERFPRRLGGSDGDGGGWGSGKKVMTIN